MTLSMERTFADLNPEQLEAWLAGIGSRVDGLVSTRVQGALIDVIIATAEDDPLIEYEVTMHGEPEPLLVQVFKETAPTLRVLLIAGSSLTGLAREELAIVLAAPPEGTGR